MHKIARNLRNHGVNGDAGPGRAQKSLKIGKLIIKGEGGKDEMWIQRMSIKVVKGDDCLGILLRIELFPSTSFA